jgi:hypothetical protein
MQRKFDFSSSSFCSGCTSLRIDLFPDPSTSPPPILQRSQSFSIGSTVRVNCYTSLSTIRQWAVFSCSGECSTPVLINGSLTLGELFVPARSLDYGVYRIQLTVTTTFSSQLASSAGIYVRIIPSPVTVNLVQLGSSMITHGQQQTLTLDPGSYSIDPDSTLFNTSVCFLISP